MSETGLNEVVNFSQMCERRVRVNADKCKVMVFHPIERVSCNVEYCIAEESKECILNEEPWM